MYIFTSEAVGAGHPDKIADQISDLILDLSLKKNSNARVAAEVLVTKNLVILAGEIKNVSFTKDELDKEIRLLIKSLGYDREGFGWDTVEIKNYLHSQSEEINECVDGSNVDCVVSASSSQPELGSKKSHKIGAGDQGIMFGYACDDTPDLMPAPIYYSQKILQLINFDRVSGILPEIFSDGKSQVSVTYDLLNGVYQPVSIDTIVLSLHHSDKLSLSDISDIGRSYIKKAIPAHLLNNSTNYFINPSGKFTKGGPAADTGLTGRKIIVDTYGGVAPHGGGAFSGKDGSKVDRSGSYLARYIAKNIVAANIARRCTVQLSYAIGVSKPISLFLDFHGSGNICESKIAEKLLDKIDMTPNGIIDSFNLKKPIFLSTAFGGHFGRKSSNSDEFCWENTDLKYIL